MKTKTLSIAAAIMALFFIGTSCSNKQKNTEETATTEQTTGAMEIDDLLANAESLTDQEVTIEGVCTHACKHGATKIFLMGSDDTDHSCRSSQTGLFRYEVRQQHRPRHRNPERTTCGRSLSATMGITLEKLPLPKSTVKAKPDAALRRKHAAKQPIRPKHVSPTSAPK